MYRVYTYMYTLYPTEARPVYRAQCVSFHIRSGELGYFTRVPMWEVFYLRAPELLRAFREVQATALPQGEREYSLRFVSLLTSVAGLIDLFARGLRYCNVYAR